MSNRTELLGSYKPEIPWLTAEHITTPDDVRKHANEYRREAEYYEMEQQPQLGKERYDWADALERMALDLEEYDEDTISERTLAGMDEAAANLKQGKVGEPVEIPVMDIMGLQPLEFFDGMMGAMGFTREDAAEKEMKRVEDSDTMMGYVHSAMLTLSDESQFRAVPPELMHSAMGLCTESGELMDALKRYSVYGKELDGVNLKEEYGDMLWYIALGCKYLGCTMAELMDMNIRKLAKRYPDKFTKADALKRDLDTERSELERELKQDVLKREEAQLRAEQFGGAFPDLTMEDGTVLSMQDDGVKTSNQYMREILAERARRDMTREMLEEDAPRTGRVFDILTEQNARMSARIDRGFKKLAENELLLKQLNETLHLLQSCGPRVQEAARNIDVRGMTEKIAAKLSKVRSVAGEKLTGQNPPVCPVHGDSHMVDGVCHGTHVRSDLGTPPSVRSTQELAADLIRDLTEMRGRAFTSAGPHGPLVDWIGECCSLLMIVAKDGLQPGTSYEEAHLGAQADRDQDIYHTAKELSLKVEKAILYTAEDKEEQHRLLQLMQALDGFTETEGGV
jgi:NTP pyrophosphatase (non-canonical NTP hydrolase)